MSICQICQKPTKSEKSKFCTLECYYIYRRGLGQECICENCGKKYVVKNSAYLKLGRMKHCSNECKNRKHSCDESYFRGEMTQEKLITLGQIIATGHIGSSNKVKVFSDIETLENIKDKLSSTYPVIKSTRGLYRVNFKSYRLVTDLLELGLTHNKLSQDVPRDDLWEGMKQTHCYKEDGDICIFTTESSKISKWIQDKFSTEVVTKSLRFTDNNNRLGFYYINIWKK